MTLSYVGVIRRTIHNKREKGHSLKKKRKKEKETPKLKGFIPPIYIRGLPE